MKINFILLLQKINPSLSDFYHPDVLVTWQQPTCKSGNLKWVNNSCNRTVRALGNPRQPLGFLAPRQTSFFIWWVKAFPGCRVNAFTKEKKRLKVCLSLRVYFLPSPVIKAPTSWDNHTSLNKNFTNFLKLSLLQSTSIIRQGQ